ADAGDGANAEADLAVYRQTYGLPPCTTANGCFRKVNQHGQAAPLPQDQGWGVEIALDLDMVSAACPACKILLVEADEAFSKDLAESENTAATLGAAAISNSWGGLEGPDDLNWASAFAHPGVAITVSTGDAGYTTGDFPSSLPSVIAVGGTALTKDPGNARGWSEKAWNGGGSSCSAWFAKPAWQHDKNCPGRTSSDISAVADPATGLAVYNTDSTPDDGHWLVVGGTSASSPFIAGIVGLSGHPERFGDASRFYRHHDKLNDVVTGSNVAFMDCGGDDLCTAGPGYDAPTGWGTPNGIGNF
ncbi:MAG: hypothetical protein QOD41_109, partial [Cryptosporangiaceae bacterium]|nr:hypothetical protein [Cryptosporangiaceae bacterium]